MQNNKTPACLTQAPAESRTLAKQLDNRHIQLIAIGGAIGTGLFMGSGNTINLSGSSIILTYAIIGFFLFFVMRALGELLLSNSHYNSFADFAGEYLDPWAGFFIGWTYSLPVRIDVTPIKNSNGAVRKHHETHFARTKISSTG